MLIRISDTTSLGAEVRAMREGLEYYRENGIHEIIIETDSMVMFQILEGHWVAPSSMECSNGNKFHQHDKEISLSKSTTFHEGRKYPC